MAQGKKQFDSAADSIFDFIFSSAKKNIRPEKPPRPSGATGNEMADGLAEVATMPITYAGEHIFTPMEETLDNYTLFNEKIEVRKGQAVKIGASGANFSDFVTDPDSFIEKSFGKYEGAKQGARTMNMVLGVGGAMDMAIGAVATKRLLKKQGITGEKALKIGRELGNEYMSEEKRNEKAEFLAAESSVFETFKDDVDEKQATDLSKAFNHALIAIKVDRSPIRKGEKLSKPQVAEMMKQRMQQFAPQGVTLSDDQLNKLVEHHLAREEKFKRGGVAATDWQLGVTNIDNRDKNLKFENLDEDYAKAEDPANKFRALKYEHLKAKTRFYSAKAQKRAEQLRRSGVTDLNQDKELQNYLSKQEEVNREIGVLSVWQRAKGSDMKASRFLGEASLYWQNVNFMLSPEGGFVALASGDFWDDGKNAKWNPSKEEDHSFKIGDDEREVEFEGLKVAKNQTSRSKRMMTGLYYLTPGSMARTLFVNGEGFGYLAHLREQKIKEGIRSNTETIYEHVNNNREDFKDIFTDKDGNSRIKDFNDKEEVTKLLIEDYSSVCEKLQEHANSGKIADRGFEKLARRLDGLNRKLKNSRALRYAAKLQGMWKVLNKYSPKRLVNRVIHGTLKWGLTLVVGRKLATRAAQRLMGGTLALRAVVRQGVRTAVHAVAQALGLAVGGVANAIIFVLTEAVMWIAEKLLKPIAKVAAFVVWGVPLTFFFLVMTPIVYLDSINPFSSIGREFDTAIGGTPIDCELCVDGEMLPIDQDIPPDYDGDCPIGDGHSRCSQAPYCTGRAVCFSHHNSNAIDVPPNEARDNIHWYAPKDGYVEYRRGVRVKGTQKCGDLIIFRTEDATYLMDHVVPFVSEGDSVAKGEPVARMALDHDVDYIEFRSIAQDPNTCATGAHWHLGMRDHSSHADSWYTQALNCNISACP